MHNNGLTIAGLIWPDRGWLRLLRWPVLAILGSLFVAACAQINVPLPIVPMTMQSFAVLAVGAAFGWRLGAATLILYAIEGAAGFPVFAQMKAGPAVLMGPTGGYLLGFVLAAALVGYLAERGFDRNPFKMMLAMLVGAAVIYVPGLLWLAQFTGWDKVLELGLLPFIAGDVVKAILAALLFPAAWLLLDRR
jgi:biotin transport system substrate-specific component